MTKRKRTNNDLQIIHIKTEDQVTRTPIKTGGELRCSGRVSSSTSSMYNMYMHENELNYLESLMSINEIKIIVRYVCQALSLFQSILLSLGQSLSHDNTLYISNYYINVVSSTLCLSGIRTHNFSGDRN